MKETEMKLDLNTHNPPHPELHWEPGEEIPYIDVEPEEARQWLADWQNYQTKLKNFLKKS